MKATNEQLAEAITILSVIVGRINSANTNLLKIVLPLTEGLGEKRKTELLVELEEISIITAGLKNALSEFRKA